jgi:serine protease Do
MGIIRMRKNVIIKLVVALTMLITGITFAGQNQTDIQKVIDKVRSDVFPAMVFVKPIVNEYGNEEKQIFGAGVIISPDGYVVTNRHIVNNSVAVNCVLYDKRQIKAELIGSDGATDLALLKLTEHNGAGAYPHADFGQSEKLKEGDFVIAVGSPFGSQRSISLGVVSNAHRYIGFGTEYKYNTWIQTDITMNPGNSGGPLIDTHGKIVGINTLGISGFGAGLSIPASMVQDIVKRLKREGKVVRAYTGLRLRALKDFHSNTFVESNHGVRIAGVEENSPALEAGIRTGDILLKVGDNTVEGTYAEMLPEIWRLLADLPVNEPVSMQLKRGDEIIIVTLTPEQKGKLKSQDFDCRRWNMKVEEISKDGTPQLYSLKEKGVYIQDVNSPGNASYSGLARGDIILKIGDKSVETIQDIRRIYEQLIRDKQREKRVMLEVLRGGLRKWIMLDYRDEYE